MFAKVAFPISSYQTFTYRLPADSAATLRVGCRVKAPLGNRLATGIIVDLSRRSDYKGDIKPIQAVIDADPVLDAALWRLIQWVSAYYLTPIGQVARVALPPSFSRNYQPPVEWWFRPVRTPDGQELDQLEHRAPAQARLLREIIRRSGPRPVSDLKQIHPAPLPLCRALADKGWLRLWTENKLPAFRGEAELPVASQRVIHTPEQTTAIRAIETALGKQHFKGFLLHGVTGSGKTEIYLELTRRVLQANRTVLILVPEIALTPQIAGRFRAAFGSKVALWHSDLRPAVRAWTWREICRGSFSVVIGARSAVFTPLPRLGLIVMDEEHEHTYKQEAPAPRYHAREVALMRGKEAGAVVVLASATPSLESYYNQIQGKLHYLTLTERATGAPYPRVSLIDMTKEQEETGKTGQTLSGHLIQSIHHRLEAGEQVIILQNRRGYSPVLQCWDCGHILTCPSCDVPLAYHRAGDFLLCHVCGLKRRTIPNTCPECRGIQLHLQGTGTQKVEDVLREAFPGADLSRIDFDSTRKRGVLTRTLKRFSEGKIDILVGTQMIAKGLDFENATLVGIVNADLGLFLPDFRSSERVFQLLYQAAGRAGRGKKPGEVLVQTYNPSEPAIQHATRLDLKKYYNALLAERNTLQYPPFTWMARLELTGKDHEKLSEQSRTVQARLPRSQEVVALGPVDCYRWKIKDRYRRQFVFKISKARDPAARKLHGYLEELQHRLKQTGAPLSGLHWFIDVDPLTLL